MKNYQLNNEQTKRYRGHISLCEIDLPGQQAICSGHVLIVGAGGLGSPVALYLAAAGVGHIVIMDADRVSLSNLQRQIMHGAADVGRPKVDSAKEAMLRVNPEIEVMPMEMFLTPDNAEEIISQYDIVVDCTDNYDSRMLINDTCVELGKAFVFGSVSRFRGYVFTHVAGTANYRTIFGDEAPEVEESCAITGILNTVVGVIGSLQATEVVKYLTKAGDLLTNRLLTFDAINMEFRTLRLFAGGGQDAESHV